jgi:putative membrane protein
MSDLNDPRVLFAAERTLLAWNRTATALIAFGFFLERTAGVLNPASASRPALSLALGLVFVLMGTCACGLSVFHYRRAIASLRPVEIPPGYWVNLSTHFTVLMGFLGLVLAGYMAFGP